MEKDALCAAGGMAPAIVIERVESSHDYGARPNPDRAPRLPFPASFATVDPLGHIPGSK